MRVEGWESLLNAHIEHARRVTFEWGKNDCALWSADWVYAATGDDFASKWRGLYASEDELDDLLIARGLSSPKDIPTAVGLVHTDPALAQRGDVVLHPQGCLGLCNGAHSYFLTARGVTLLRTRDCVTAWKVR